MDEESLEGAVAAGTYFMQLYPYVFATGDLSVWDEMRTEECSFCADISSKVETLHADDGSTTGGEIAILNSSGGGPYGEGHHYLVQLDISEEPSVRISGDGSREEVVGGDYPEILISVLYTSDGWRIEGLNTGSDQ